jgi:putative ABC transport system substrate-binding protein
MGQTRTVLASAAMFASLVAVVDSSTAQQAQHIPKIGSVTSLPTLQQLPAGRAFLQGMHDHGYLEGLDFTIENRTTEAKPERYAALNAELASLPVDVIVAGVCGEPLNAARRATKTIPIVVLSCNDDMVETGVIESYRHPGGNITGLSKLTPELASKRLELLKQCVPSLQRVAVIWDPDYSSFKADWRELRAGAKRLGVTLVPVEFRRPDDLDAAFEAVRRERVDGLIAFSDVVTYAFAKRVGALAAASGLPSMFAFREVPDAGALMAYGPSIPGLWYRGADYVVRILHGAKPADMPVEQPTRFDFVINMKAAKALGLTIPQSIVLQATEVIE